MDIGAAELVNMCDLTNKDGHMEKTQMYTSLFKLPFERKHHRNTKTQIETTCNAMLCNTPITHQVSILNFYDERVKFAQGIKDIPNGLPEDISRKLIENDESERGLMEVTTSLYYKLRLIQLGRMRLR